MKIKIFGRLVDVFGGEIYDVENIQSLQQLVTSMEEKFPELLNKNYLVAINQEVVDKEEDIEIKEADEVALLPPYSGG